MPRGVQALGAPFDTADCDGDGVRHVAIASGNSGCEWRRGPDACVHAPAILMVTGGHPWLVRVLSLGARAACPEDLDGNGVVGFRIWS